MFYIHLQRCMLVFMLMNDEDDGIFSVFLCYCLLLHVGHITPKFINKILSIYCYCVACLCSHLGGIGRQVF